MIDSALAFIDGAVGIASARSASSAAPAAKLLAAARGGREELSAAGRQEALSGSERRREGRSRSRVAGPRPASKATVKASGKSAEELAKLFPPDSEAAKRLRRRGRRGKDGATRRRARSTKLADFAKLDPGERATVIADGDRPVRLHGRAEPRGRLEGGDQVARRGPRDRDRARRLAVSGSCARCRRGWRPPPRASPRPSRPAPPRRRATSTSPPSARDAAQHADRALEFIARRAGVTRDRAGDDPRPRRRRQPRAHAPAGRREGPDPAGPRGDRA